MRHFLTALLLLSFLTLGTQGLAVATELINDPLVDTTKVDVNRTTAVVDTNLHKIYLPIAGSNALDIHEDGDIVVVNGSSVETYSFNGSTYVKNPALSVGTTNPIAVSAKINNTDVVALSATAATRYQFSGAGLVANPLLGVQNLSGAVSLSTRPNYNDIAVVDSTGVNHYSYNGSTLVRNPSLSVGNLTSPLAVALRPDTLDMVVLDGKVVRYFSYNGSSLVENPYLQISGLSAPTAVAFASTGDVLIVDGKAVKRYSFNGSGYVFNSILSVTTAGLNTPFAVAARPGNYDFAVYDGSTVRYFAFDGSKMIENTAFSINGLTAPFGYASGRKAYSLPLSLVNKIGALRITAIENKPSGTSIDYAFTGDGINWTPGVLGAKTKLTVPGTKPGWSATLWTSSPNVTPEIVAPIILDGSYFPYPPLNLSVTPVNTAGYVTSTQPTLQWTFSDPDVGDRQSALQVVIMDGLTGNTLYNSGKISSLAQADPPPDEPGPVPLTLGNPAGAQNYFAVPSGAITQPTIKWKVRLWDDWDLESPWTFSGVLNIFALHTFRVTNIVNPPATPPNPPLPTTAFPVYIKAGAAFDFDVQSLGPVNTVTANFGSGSPVTLTPVNDPQTATTNTWKGRYFTDPGLPTGTKISVTLTGVRTADGSTTTLVVPDFAEIRGSIYDDWVVLLKK